MRGPRWFRAATAGARMLVGAALAAATIAAVVLVVATPLPGVARTPVSLEVAPTPSDTVITCPGPILAAGRNAGNAAELTDAAAASVVAAAPGESAAPAANPLAAPSVTAGGGPAALERSPFENAPGELVAAQSSSVAADDLVGLTAATCVAPQFDSWLVGGATTTGSADLLLLANPGEATATITVTVFGAAGPVVPPGGADIVVPARTQIVVPLAGLALGESAPVLHVSASGSPVSAALQSSRTLALTPIGVDLVAPTAAPASEQVITGVTEASASAQGEPASAVVRVLSADSDATVTVTVSTVGSTTPLQSAEAPLTAGHPVEIDIPELPAGRYVVRVAATAPVVASAWATTGLAGPQDFAWFAAGPRLDAPTLLAVADGPSPTLHVAAGAATAEVTLTPVAGGSEQTFSVDADGSAVVPLEVGGVWRIASSAPITASVAYHAAGALAGYAVLPSEEAQASVRVYP